jgi:hypothetical protein
MQFAGTVIKRTHVRGLDDNSLYRLHDRVKKAVASLPAESTQSDRVQAAGVERLVVQELGRRNLRR